MTSPTSTELTFNSPQPYVQTNDKNYSKPTNEPTANSDSPKNLKLHPYRILIHNASQTADNVSRQHCSV